MKPIELTEEHKTKLLEMCNVLFIPDGDDHIYYSNFRFKPIYNWLGKLVRTTDYIQSINDKNGDIYEIHWFEFCRYYIFVEINKRNKRPWKETSLEFMNCKHPIDYLYEQFKKLNETKETS